MREYDEATLKKLQQTVLGIFKDFDKICQENGLSYYAFAGTGIGALRHGGFIPWDDDIDVAIPRRDYEKLVEILERDHKDKYTVVTAGAFPDYPLMTTRITLNDSLFVEYALKNVKKAPLGIFLDVYPLDDTDPADAKHRRHQRACFVYSKLLILKHVPFPVLGFRGFKAFLAHCATAAVWFFLNLFCVSHRFLYKQAMKHAGAYAGRDTGYLEHFFPQKLGNGVVDKTNVFPLRRLKFEDTEMNFPCRLEDSLTRDFGDYMQLPPVEKRKNHFPFRLKFPGEAEITHED